MTATRNDILKALEKLSERYPAWRFGQMVANVSYMARGATVEAIWDVEDQEFLNAINEHLNKVQSKDGA